METRQGEVELGALDVKALPPAVPEQMFGWLFAAKALHKALCRRYGVMDLVVTDNRRRLISTRINPRGRRELRVHRMFLGECAVLRGHLVEFAGGRRDAEARAAIRAHIESSRAEISAAPRRLARRSGESHDLGELLERVRETLPESEALSDIEVTWGRRGKGRRSIRFGSYDFGSRLIRVHPALDQSWVPEYFVEYVLFHELLHAVCPPETQGGRRVVHTREFRRREAQFERYEDALSWERENLARLLGS